MTTMTLEELSKKMQKIDFCMLSTKDTGGVISSRPMSNNGDVEYDGDSWFYSYKDSRKVADITADPKVSLSFSAGTGLFGKPGIFISVEGAATLTDDRAALEEHWVSELDRWFPEGIDTPGITLIKVHADKVEYWDGEDNGTIRV